MGWKPDGEDQKYIELIASMCLDTLQGRGVSSKATFIINLEMVLDTWQPGRTPKQEEDNVPEKDQ